MHMRTRKKTKCVAVVRSVYYMYICDYAQSSIKNDINFQLQFLLMIYKHHTNKIYYYYFLSFLIISNTKSKNTSYRKLRQYNAQHHKKGVIFYYI